MCQLFGFNGYENIKLNELLKEFFARSRRYPHGWGIATFDDGVHIDKEPVDASTSRYLKAILEEPFYSSNMIAHLRYGTIGELTRSNCHPFVYKDNYGRKWTLMHNGTIFNAGAMDHKYARLQKGTSDSERVLLYIIDHINLEQDRLYRPLETYERFQVIDKVIHNLASGNKLNLIIYDGEIYYVHYNQAHTLYTKKLKEGRLFCTEPLMPTGEWEEVPFMRLLGYENGFLQFKGEEHHDEYFDDPEKYKDLFMSYSNL